MHKVIAPPGNEPIDIVTLRTHLRVDTTLEDDLILAYLSSARDYAEQVTGLAFAPATWEMGFDSFSSALPLEGGMVSSVDFVLYLDSNGVDTQLDPTLYAIDSYSTPNWIVPAYGTSFPHTYSAINAVRVRYRVGSQPLPPSVRAALLLIVGHLYLNREQNADVQIYSLPMGVKALLDPYRMSIGI